MRNDKSSIWGLIIATLIVCMIGSTAIADDLSSNSNMLITKGAPSSSVRNWDIYMTSPYGSTEVLLFDDSWETREVKWSPDMSKIVFITYTSEPPAAYELFVMDADGGSVERLTFYGDSWGPASPRWRDNSTIWWVRTGTGDLYRTTLDGLPDSVIYEAPPGTSLGQIDVNDSLVVYSRQSTSSASTFDLYLNNLSFTNERRITNNSRSDVGPGFSPDGQYVVYRGSSAANGYSAPQNIFKVNIGSLVESQLTYASGGVTYGVPVWAPDGTKIACYGYAGYQHEIYTMNPDGTELMNYTNTPDLSEVLWDWQLTPMLFVNLDIKPGSCPNPLNVKSPGEDWLWVGDEDEEQDADATSTVMSKPKQNRHKKAVLPAAILGSTDVDVMEIDLNTVMLNGVPVLRWAYEDVATPMSDDSEECECNSDGPDGYTDLTLKFLRDEIIASLGEVYDGQVISLTFSGQLIDGTPFEGSDCILIIANEANMVDGNIDGPVVDVNNYPNPFNPTTTLSFALETASHVRLDVFNITGQLVTTLVNKYYETGRHSVMWDAKDNDGRQVSSGIYFYRVEADGFSQSKKMVLLK